MAKHKPIFLVKNRIKLRATRALLILQPRKNQTLFQRRSRTQPSRSYFGCDSELKFMFLTTKLTLILTLNNLSLTLVSNLSLILTLNNLSLTDSLDAFERILGAVEDRCHKLGLQLITITYAIPLYARYG